MKGLETKLMALIIFVATNKLDKVLRWKVRNHEETTICCHTRGVLVSENFLSKQNEYTLRHQNIKRTDCKLYMLTVSYLFTF